MNHMTFIAKTVDAPGAPYHLAPTGDGNSHCGPRLLRNTAPTLPLTGDRLCPQCFTRTNIGHATRANNNRPWLGTDATRVDRQLQDAFLLLETPDERAHREALVARIHADYTGADFMDELAEFRRVNNPNRAWADIHEVFGS